MRRSYTTANEIVPHLERIIRDLRNGGRRFLPSERQLQEQVGASRMTLRKALDVLEGQGMLIKDARGRMIDGVKPVKGGAVMVAAGWDFPANPVWLRLSMQLEKRMAEKGLSFRQVLYGYDDPEKTWPGPLTEIPEIIIFTDAPNDYIKDKVLALNDRCAMIATDEDYIGMTDYVVSLNNFQAGKVAAETMLRQGVKNPAMLFWDYGYVPFIKRRNGFVAGLKQAGIDPEGRVYSFFPDRGNMRNNTFIQAQLDATTKICAAGHDGLFVWSDENIRMVHERICETRRVPEDFVLMTLDGCGECRSQNFMIDAVSHNTDGMATELADLVEKLVEHQPHEKITLINTEVLHGKTGRR